MGLKNYEVAIALDTLYEIKQATVNGTGGQSETINPSISTTGTITLYGINSATQPAALANMVADPTGTSISGVRPFGKDSVIPRYFAVTGTSSETILTGIEIVNNLGAIS